MSETAPKVQNDVAGAPCEWALLPWEKTEDWRALYQDYVSTYAPAGPAETHLVSQLAWIAWRRARLLLGERALHMADLDRATSRERYDRVSRRALSSIVQVKPEISSAGAIQRTDREDAEAETEWQAMVDAATKADAILEEEADTSYAKALSVLPAETRDWFDECCEEEKRFTADAEGLQRFLIAEVLPFFRAQLGGAKGGPSVRLQAWGESLDPDRMDKLLALEERLMRQFERALGMLIRLQERRADTAHPV